ncbi:hypothetical protein NLG97_g7897 [Lecanicillium saksenae]|uniref:Uncharacterized protein n=1 Tax=Lecanicillium saksenae TaxID=468837 RepID=A0ACC1QLM5_9HYPO|nr:hypothetical protein NLG97_g7897 [Lecanicillium saksenae]
MSRYGIIFLRVLQGLLAIVNLALAAYVSRLRTLRVHRVIIYLEIAVRQKRMIMAHRLTSMGVEGFNAILYFGGFIAFALTLSESNPNTACEGLSCTLSRAVAVIAAAEFSAWIASTILAAQEWFQSEAHMKKITAARRQMAEANVRP